MSTDEINRAIADHLGIYAVRDKNSDLWSLIDGRLVVHGTHNGGIDEQHCWRVNCPDYCGSLDVMHKTEKALFDGSAELWTRYLEVELPDLARTTSVECSPARQRAEAALRTIGKWRDA